MNQLQYTAELSHRQAALLGEAQMSRQARPARRPAPSTGWLHRHSGRRTSATAPPGLALHGT
jgi:hypothetical protein